MTSPKKTSLIIVRHPFEKIVAAFRDKLERTHEDTSFFQVWPGSNAMTFGHFSFNPSICEAGNCGNEFLVLNNCVKNALSNGF